jgi:hypothetical protein
MDYKPIESEDAQTAEVVELQELSVPRDITEVSLGS